MRIYIGHYAVEGDVEGMHDLNEWEWATLAEPEFSAIGTDLDKTFEEVRVQVVEMFLQDGEGRLDFGPVEATGTAFFQEVFIGPAVTGPMIERKPEARIVVKEVELS